MKIIKTALLNNLNSSALIDKINKLVIVGLCTSCISPNTLNMYKHPTESPPQSNQVEGINISHHQVVIDWAQLTPDRSGKAFVIMKATEGATYKDPMFVQNFTKASAAGFRPGAYHFLRFGSSSPSAQMANFISQIEAAKAVLTDPIALANQEPIIALDIEYSRKMDHYSLVGNVTEESVRYLKDKANITPYIYTTQYFWNKHVPTTPDIVKECPLWIAKWRKNPPLADELPTGWNSWTIWQYTNQGSVPGITGRVDLDKMMH